jgi:tetratricopeptide (TPR) repeat protein
MGIDFQIRDEDDGDGLRRSCIPNILMRKSGRPSGTQSTPSRRPRVTRKDHGWDNAAEGKDGEVSEVSVFDEELVSVLSPVPRENQQQQGFSDRDTPPTTSSSTWSNSRNTSSPLGWLSSSSNHSHYASISNNRVEFCAVVSSGSLKDVDLLLTPPMPSDRSSRRRLQYERDVRMRQNKNESKEGEAEPPGKRGESILQPRMRSYPLASGPESGAGGEGQTSVVRQPMPHDGHSPRQRLRSPSSCQLSPQYIQRSQEEGKLLGVQHPLSHNSVGNVQRQSVDLISHPTFSVPFPLASTPPPPPPPPLPPPLGPVSPLVFQNPSASPPLQPNATNQPRRHKGSLSCVKAKEQSGEDIPKDEGRELSYYISSSGSTESHSSDSSFDVAVVKSVATSHGSSIMDNIEALNSLAMDHIRNGEYENSLAVLNHILKVQQERYGEVHPANAGIYHNMGTVQAKRASAIATAAGESEQRHCRAQAVSCFQAAARIARDSLGPTHPNVAVSLVRIGLVLLESRQYHNALLTFKEALRLRMCAFGPQHRLVANVYNNMGLCCAQIGSFKEAKEYLNAAITIQRKLAVEVGTDQELLELADTLFNLGGLNMEWIRQEGPAASRVNEAESCFTEVLQVRTRVALCGLIFRSSFNHLLLRAKTRSRLLGPSSAMVLQVKTLLDIAKALPKRSSLRGDPSAPVIPVQPEVRQTKGHQHVGTEGKANTTKYTTDKGMQTSVSPSRNTERKERLYSLLVALVEQDPRRREKSERLTTAS